ncbi:MAG: DNA primase [Candidatus Omnitrophica bacterium]|nr:DNA primase [Candidatus Omnitrophota bacterium]MDD5737973.1 DNA primase [Candidatus Omnitrophota bacterium]
MAFSEQVLEEIQSKSDIVEIIGSYIPLRRAGRNYKANCPFHKEKTPSFMISPAKQIFHCFGCGAGGNVFGFVMKMENIDFPEAVRTLAEKAGVKLPSFTRSQFETSSYAVQIYKTNEMAAAYYRSMLSGTDAGKRAAAYLKNRGISGEAAQKAGLGFAPDEWSGLINFAKGKGVDVAVLERSGLVVPKEGGGHYDRFRNKIIFPIFDIKDRVVAFGARVLDNSTPKYINSPETEVYIKSRHLYGLNFSVKDVKEKDLCVIVEGYLDFLVPYDMGARNIAASLGTSLTDSQARLIKRYTKNVVMLYDGDSAGEAASLRGLDVFLQENITVKVAVLPKGFDPDSFIRGKGLAAFEALISSASDLFDYKLGILSSRYDSRTSSGKAKICSEMLPTIAKVADAVLKFEFIRRLSEKLQIREEALLSEIKKVKPESRGYELPEEFVSESRPQAAMAEKIIVGLMLEDPDVIAEVKGKLKPSDFEEGPARKVVEEIFANYGDGKSFNPSRLINRLSDPELTRLIAESSSLIEDIKDKQKNLEDCIRWMAAKHAKARLAELQNLIKAAQVMGDEGKVNQLVAEYSGLIKYQKEFARR